MALLNPMLLQTVVLIEAITGKGTTSPIATGFLVGFRIKGSEQDNLYHTFLVTNRHVFEGKDAVCLRFNARDGGLVRFQIPLKAGNENLWLAHKTRSVDLAMLTISMDTLKGSGTDARWINENMFGYFSDFEKHGISLGDGIFVLGFPMGISGKSQNYAIARGGILARADKEIIGSEKAFMIDASIFPGNSGGPVFIKPELSSLQGTGHVSSQLLIGVVSAYKPYLEPLFSHQSTPPKAIAYNMENSGLAMVVPLHYAKDIYIGWRRQQKKLLKVSKSTDKSVST